MSKKRELHQSQIGTALKCMKQYEFRYILGIKTPPKAALTVGSSTHAAIQHNFLHKLNTGEDAPREQILEAYSTDFDVRAKDTEWGEDDQGKQKDMGARLVQLHHEKLAPFIQPLKVEEKFTLETDAGFDLGGTIDLVQKDGTIVDHKTSKMKYAEDALTRAIQPALYDFAYEALYGKKSKGFRYDILVKPTAKKAPEVQQIRAKISPEDRAWALGTIAEVDKAIAAGVSTPAPDGAWWCSSTWCGFWNMCKGKGRAPAPVEKPLTKMDGIFPLRRRMAR